MDNSNSKAADGSARRRPLEASGRPGSAGLPGPSGSHGSSEPQRAAPSLFSPTSQAERQRVGKRLLWALPLALALFGLLLLLGPSAEEIERRLTIYGKEGPLQLMPEIAIEDGQHEVHQQRRPQTTAPEGAPDYQVVPEVPLPQETTPPPRETVAFDPGTDQGETVETPDETILAQSAHGDGAADLLMPSQHAESDFIIRKLVRPLYPASARMADQRRPLLTVEAAFFLDEEANIVAVLIQSNEGGPEFAEAVRNAMEQWEFEPRWRDGKPPAPRWLVLTWRFRSPLRDMFD